MHGHSLSGKITLMTLMYMNQQETRNISIGHKCPAFWLSFIFSHEISPERAITPPIFRGFLLTDTKFEVYLYFDRVHI